MTKVKRKSRISAPIGIHFIEPMYALAVQSLPVGDGWLYEVKFDGYRCLAGRDKDGVTLWSRRGNLFTDQFPQIARACERLPAGTLLDGEVVAVDHNGHISFNLLQHHRSAAQALLFYAFDVLIYRGESLLKVPLRNRRETVGEIFEKMGKKAAPLMLSEPLEGTPADLVKVVKKFGFEGIVAKRADSFYESGKRSGAWQKYRVNKGQELVIGGYVPNNPLDSIVVGYYDGHKLIYVAKVRNGFVPNTRREVFAQLRGLKVPTCPFVNLPEKKRTMYSLTKEEMKKCIWLKPERVAQIEFVEWTPDGHLRHSKFVGLRDDKDARSVTREA